MTSEQIKFYRVKKFLKTKIIENDSGERKPEECFLGAGTSMKNVRH